MPLYRISDGKPILTPAEQARINGAKSRGPKSPEGKARSSRNALKHGLTAQKHTVLDIEDKSEFNALMDSSIDEFRPHSLIALQLVEKLTHLDWTLHRLRALETAYLNFKVSEAAGMEQQPNPFDEAASAEDDPMAGLVKSWIAASGDKNPLELLMRYSTALQSQFNATYKNYLSLEDRKYKRSRNRDLDHKFQPPYTKPEFPQPTPNPEPVQTNSSERPVDLGGSVSPQAPLPLPEPEPAALEPLRSKDFQQAEAAVFETNHHRLAASGSVCGAQTNQPTESALDEQQPQLQHLPRPLVILVAKTPKSPGNACLQTGALA